MASCLRGKDSTTTGERGGKEKTDTVLTNKKTVRVFLLRATTCQGRGRALLTILRRKKGHDLIHPREGGGKLGWDSRDWLSRNLFLFIVKKGVGKKGGHLYFSERRK